jgi:hypothetical protein
VASDNDFGVLDESQEVTNGKNTKKDTSDAQSGYW